MKHLRPFLFLFLFTSLIIGSQAQPYQIGAGLRLSEWYGIQGKYFISSTKAFEVIISPVSKGMHISGLLEVHSGVKGVSNLSFYGGIGPRIGLWADGRYNPWWNDNWNGKDARDYYDRNGNSSEGRFAVGMDMIIGMEYRIPALPLSLAIDWKPAVMLWGNPGLILEDVALSIRFVQ